MFNLLAHSFYLNLVKGKTALASADAERDAPMLHAVRQRPIQAIQQRLNMLTDDAITQDHLESTALLGLFESKRRKENLWISLCEKCLKIEIKI